MISVVHATARPGEHGPALVFADATGTVFLADMTGDGLADFVRVTRSRISYWPASNMLETPGPDEDLVSYWRLPGKAKTGDHSEHEPTSCRRSILMEQPETIVHRAINAKELSPTMQLQIERLGQCGVTLLAGAVREGALPADKKVRALRLMGLITRQYYVEGKLELIRLASRLVEDGAEDVRNSAAEAVLLSIEGIMRLGQCEAMRDEASQLAVQAIASALRHGIRGDIAARAASWSRDHASGGRPP